MATGITKREQLSDDSPTAKLGIEKEYPLPADAETCSMGLDYPNKLSNEIVLNAPIEFSFLECTNSKYKSFKGNIAPNAVVLSDNYLAMRRLLDNLANQVTLIYLDPPFQTGMDFQSRQLKHAYKDQLDPVSYIEFMRRRFILMRDLLSDEGSLYVHIGYQMVFHLKVILDEIFGASNYRNLIVRKKCSSKNFTRNQYPNLHDFILFYSKTKNYKWNQPAETPKQNWIEKEYPKIDARGRRYKLVPVHAPGTRNGETGKPWRDKLPPPGKHWQLPPSKLDELDAAGDIHWSRNGNPRRKVYLPGDKKVPLTDYWEKFRDAHHQSICITGYPTEKNYQMMQTIVSASSEEGDLVIDPFCGSGSTLQAAGELKRSWIGIDNSVAAFHAVFDRFFNGLKPMGDYVEKPKRKPRGVELFPGFKKNQNKASTTPITDFRFIVDSDFAEMHEEELAELCKYFSA